MNFSLSRAERLRSAKVIRTVYESGTTGFVYPFRYGFVPLDPGFAKSPVQVMIAVPKRRLKRAVDRNLVRRRTREAYRHHKQVLYDALIPGNRHYALVLSYVAVEVEPWGVIEKKIIVLLQGIASQVQAGSNQ